MTRWRAVPTSVAQAHAVRDREIMRWEDRYVPHNSQPVITPETAKAVIAYVWQSYGLVGPPIFSAEYDKDPFTQDVRTAPGCWASCDGGYLYAYSPVPTTVVLHELAHAMTDDSLDYEEGRAFAEIEVHGDLWLANYLDLLDRFVGGQLCKIRLMGTLPPGRAPNWYPTIHGRSWLVAAARA